MKNLYLIFILIFINCFNTKSQSVSFIADTEQGCAPLNVNFTNTSNIDTNGVSFYWLVQDYYQSSWFVIDTGYNSSYTFLQDGYYIVYMEAYTSNMEHLGGYNEIIEVILTDSFAISTGHKACPGEKVNFYPLSNTYSVVWNFGDGSPEVDQGWVQHMFFTPGFYNVSCIMETDCGIDTAIEVIEITNTAIPNVDINVNGGNSFCLGDGVKFESQYDAAEYLWNFDDGFTSNEKNPIHKFMSYGTKNVVLTVTNICGNASSASTVIHIENSIPSNADFSLGSYSYCPGEPINCGAWNSGNYFWNFGDGGSSSLRNPNYLYKDTGTYLVTLIVVNGCGNADTSSETITIAYDTTSTPEAYIVFNSNNFWNEDTVTICVGEEVSFKNYTWSNTDLDFSWDFGDGNTSTDRDVSHIFNTQGTFEVVYTATNNCNGSNSVSKWVIVDSNALPVANLGSLPNHICPGEKVYFFDDANKVDYSSNLYSIWFGDGDSLVNLNNYNDTVVPTFSHTYLNTGTYIYTFNVMNTCGNILAISDTITVDNNALIPAFYYVSNSTESGGGGDNEDRRACPNDLVQFIAAGGSSYFWDFGDGSTTIGQLVYHAYNDTGTYNALMIGTNTCGRIDTIETEVSISDTVKLKLWFDTDKDFTCSGDTINFNYDNEDPRVLNYSFFWDFDDGSTSTERSPSHVYAEGGEYYVKFVVTYGCGTDSVFKVIHVDNAIVDFSADDVTVPENTSVHFTNLSTGAVNYLWNFGDNTTSTMTNPSHTYTTEGIYNVSLTATSSYGCVTTLIKEEYIYVNNLIIANTILKNPTCFGKSNGYIDIAVTGGTPPYTYHWSTGDYSQDINGLNAGQYTVTVRDVDNILLIKKFTLTQPPIISLLIDKFDLSCFNSNDGSIELDVTGGTPPYNYNWSDGFNSAINQDIDAGFYEFTITDANNCIKIDTSTLYQPDEINVTTYGFNPSCGNLDGVVIAQIDGASIEDSLYTIEWDDINITTNDTLANIEAGVYWVYVTDINTSCVDSAHILLNDFGSPNIYYLDKQDINCYGESTGSATAYVSGISPFSYYWDTNPPQTTETVDSLSAGEYIVEITDNNGCISYNQVNISQPNQLQLSFEIQNPKCYGNYDGSVKAIVTGGANPYNYLWSNGEYNQENINRNAGVYTVTVTDGYNCKVSESVTLTNPQPIQVTVFSSNPTYYSANDGVIDLFVQNTKPPVQYHWSTNQNSQDIENLVDGSYSVTITDSDQCVAYQTVTLTQPPKLNVNIIQSGSLNFCQGENVILDAGAGFDSYIWSSGETSQSITAIESGIFSVTVSNSISVGFDTVEVVVSHPFEGQDLCLVTVDTTNNKNLIVWEPTEGVGIVSYNIYKETTVSDQYVLIGNILAGEITIFTDTLSNPSQQSDRYKISIIDTCGNESSLSNAHKTMHLTVSSGIGVFNLIWENYEGFSFGSYVIYKGTTPSNLTPIGYIQSNLTSYSDFQIVPNQAYYYNISVIKSDTCFVNTGRTQSGPYSQSISNIDDYAFDNTIICSANAGSDNSICGKTYPLQATQATSGSTILWTALTEGIFSDSSSTSSEVTVNNFGQYSFVITETTVDCNESDTVKISFYDNPTNLDSISGIKNVTQNTIQCYSVTYVVGSYYNWTVTGGSILSGQGSSAVCILWTNIGQGSISVYEKSQYNCTGNTVSTNVSIVTGIEEIYSENSLTIYPNPFSETTTISFNNSEFNSYNLKLTDVTGKVVRIINDIKSDTYILNREDLPKGFYIIELSGKENYFGRVVVD